MRGNCAQGPAMNGNGMRGKIDDNNSKPPNAVKKKRNYVYAYIALWSMQTFKHYWLDAIEEYCTLILTFTMDEIKLIKKSSGQVSKKRNR